MELNHAIDQGLKHLRGALEEYSPNAIFAGFSGGTDSLMATHLLHELRDDMAALHINTGIGMKRTRKYVRSTCDQMGWDLEEYRAEDNGYSYDRMVKGNAKGVRGGFPGPPMHPIYYRRLKERQIEAAHREHKGEYGGKILLVTGIRKDESEVRSGYANQVVQHQSGVVWVNLIYNVSGHKKQEYIDLYGLETNPVSDVYGMSGECLCGAFDEGGGRLCELKHACDRFGEPETYERIVSLQKEVWNEYPWRYDERPPHWFAEAREGQMALEGLPRSDDQNRVAQRMCVGCGKSPQDSGTP
jgi:3'-phosphoadenosine 5'-phosphosulfate sulfotransferase (PAPS reductase)/FAD synthetase